MPRRPAQHVQERLSKDAFSRALPDEWVFRVQDQDYGMDGEVEIFQDESATGRIFKVQLKGTAGKDNRLRVRLLPSTVSYFAEMKLPVLIVLHHGRSGALYGKWMHAFDPYYGGQTSKGTTLKFSSADELTPERWQSLAADVEMYYGIRDPKRALPVPVRFETVGSTVRGVDSLQLVRTIRALTSQFPDLIQIREEDSSAATVLVDDEVIRATFRDVGSATAHHLVTANEPATPDGVAADVLLTLALALDQVGQTDAAARMIAAIADRAHLLFYPDVLFRVIGVFTRSHRVIEAVALAERFGAGNADENELMAMLFLTPAMMRSAYLLPHERDAVTRRLRKQLKSAEEQGTRRDIGIAHYNLGNHFGSKAAWKEAASHFAMAAHYDPDYLSRAYFPREFGGALFLSGQFDLAVAMYDRAMNLKADAMTPALRADALMYSGRYKDARTAFETHLLEFGLDAEDEWRLKAWVLALICTRVGDEQNRRAEEAVAAADVSDEAPTHEERRERLENALRMDALCSEAWFNLGVVAASEGDVEEGTTGFLVSAIIEPHNVDGWAAAAAFCDLRTQLGRDVISCAYRWNGEMFLSRLEDLLKTFNRDAAAEVMTATRELVDDSSNRSAAESVTVRMLHEGADFDSLIIPGRAPRGESPKGEK